jgi:anti-sigma factor RsiW
MSACPEFDLLVSLHATNALSAEEAARLDAHLATCDACRAELDAVDEALSLARLPAPTAAEHRALAGLAERTIEAAHRSNRQRGLVRRVAFSVAVAASVAFAVVVPLRGARHAPAPDATAPAAQREVVAQNETAGWQEPDLDTLWAESDVVDFSADTGDGTYAVYAAASNGAVP